MRKAFLFLLPLLFCPLDIPVSSFFFNEGSFSNHPFFVAFYKYGEYPALFTVGIATALFPLSYLLSSLRKYRLPLLFLSLNLVLGGFLINEKLFKDHFGRPRPKQTAFFGGTEEFRPLYKPDISFRARPLKSFACGHATAGFYFFAFAKLSKGRWRTFWNVTALLLGALLGLSRIAQGGHFLSDVLTSSLIMWGSAAFLDHFILRRYERTYTKTA